MELVQRITPERVLAFTKIQQAIREDDLWTAAWCMWKFLRVPHVLLAKERKLLQEEYSYQVDRFQGAVDFFAELCYQHAKGDHHDWLENGTPFAAVEEGSFSQHEENSIQPLKVISTYGRSAGYLRAIINMKVTLPSVQDGELFELEAMGPSPGVINVKNLEIPDHDWVIISPEEARRGAYHGHQWTTKELTTK
ncbi:uncharacterized protein PGTG_14550 [Puccinia graminis f. sp. tritici CRL 75-36-700-3]|uniref:Uncharacterized protein n=1 Tax=Puccinia graminis f. sp. tritici (strain CRL 75-36-700-3 / race SCCL) TaxID=418459 RepID=E3KU60_PUCGT|nr:uncharacterized protein PGTG_14550 [Puccinia graminis f. sp. tritici CRL 75-36-700-3]EFP87835.1 hypothetical protein PGTG_14550 [Puccinia graminis f. sp. tritici CRL 75-36-700-3]